MRPAATRFALSAEALPVLGRLLSALVAAGLALALRAGAEEDPLAAYLWDKRPIVVFADSARDPRFKRQIEFLSRDRAALDERDVVVLTDTDPKADGPLRRALRPHGFMLVVIAKDGTIAWRKPDPRPVREIVRVIDNMPLRLQEIEERRLGRSPEDGG